MARAKSLMATLLLSFGTPMIRAGDEILDSKKGNNNTYSQDNDYSWIDWKNITPMGKEMLHMVRELMHFRATRPIMEHSNFFTEDVCTWYKPDGKQMLKDDWHFYVKALSCLIKNNKNTNRLFFVFNAYHEAIKWTLPSRDFDWRLVFSTEKSLKKQKVKSAKIPPYSVVVFEKERT